MTRSRIIYKIRHRWGIILGKVASELPHLANALRSKGIPLNGYMPWVSRRTSKLLMQPDFLFEFNSQKYPNSLDDLIAAQDEPKNLLDGPVTPIRISRVTDRILQVENRRKLVSEVWPGDKYLFTDEDAYMRQYSEVHFGLSPEKGGWDTMRSAEMAALGTFPLIPKLDKAHPLTLHYYPKQVLIEIWRWFEAGIPLVPTAENHAWLQDWSMRYLTASAQATLLLKRVGFKVDDPSLRVLHVDLNLLRSPDYVAMGMYAGLTRVLGERFRSCHSPEYLYQDSRTDPRKLYGRGFSYHKALEVGLRGERVEFDPLDRRQDFSRVSRSFKPDLLVVTGIEYLDSDGKLRMSVLDSLAGHVPKVALVYGGDFPISAKLANHLGKFGFVFAREFEKWP